MDRGSVGLKFTPCPIFAGVALACWTRLLRRRCPFITKIPGRLVVALYVSCLYYYHTLSFFSSGILKGAPVSHSHYESVMLTILPPQGSQKVYKTNIQVIIFKLHLASLILYKTYYLGERWPQLRFSIYTNLDNLLSDRIGPCVVGQLLKDNIHFLNFHWIYRVEWEVDQDYKPYEEEGF